MSNMPVKIGHSLVGKRFGNAIVIKREGLDTQHHNSTWLCECICGKLFVTSRCNLIQKHTQSCGCYNIQRIKEYFTTHGKTESQTYFRWTDMKTRCLNKKSSHYKNYGGRGIKICDRWLNSFEYFLEDMGTVPENMTLERINNDKGYYKENCKWILKSHQPKNRRNNIYVIFNGEKIPAREFWILTGKKHTYNTYLKYIKEGRECELFR